MEKKDVIVTGRVLIIFSIILIYIHLMSGGDYAIAILSAFFGATGTICLYYADNVDIDTAIFSSGFCIAGGAVFPIADIIKEYAPALTTFCYLVAIFLIIAPAKKKAEAPDPVHH